MPRLSEIIPCYVERIPEPSENLLFSRAIKNKCSPHPPEAACPYPRFCAHAYPRSRVVTWCIQSSNHGSYTLHKENMHRKRWLIVDIHIKNCRWHRISKRDNRWYLLNDNKNTTTLHLKFAFQYVKSYMSQWRNRYLCVRSPKVCEIAIFNTHILFLPKRYATYLNSTWGFVKTDWAVNKNLIIRYYLVQSEI